MKSDEDLIWKGIAVAVIQFFFINNNNNNTNNYYYRLCLTMWLLEESVFPKNALSCIHLCPKEIEAVYWATVKIYINSHSPFVACIAVYKKLLSSFKLQQRDVIIWWCWRWLSDSAAVFIISARNLFICAVMGLLWTLALIVWGIIVVWPWIMFGSM